MGKNTGCLDVLLLDDERTRTPGMTHERDYGIEDNRPPARTHESYADEAKTSGKQVAETGLVHRQPL
jgi:hypothetical protein